MKKFRKFSEKKQTLIGFASIHKEDDSDKLLNKVKTALIGFASIHKNDDSDKLLKKNLKEDEEITPAIKGPFQEALDHQLKAKIHEKDSEIFHHHWLMNVQHEQDHLNYMRKNNIDPNTPNFKDTYSPIRNYTYASRDLNWHLIKQHMNADQLEQEEKKGVGLKLHDKSPEEMAALKVERQKKTLEMHEGLQKETNHPDNALKDSVIVHSGVGKEMGNILESANLGDVIHTPAYTSTTTKLSVARNFGAADYKIPSGKWESHLMHFHLPKGYMKGRHVANISDMGNVEHEMVLHHGQKWRKVDHYTSHMDNDVSEHHHHFVPDND